MTGLENGWLKRNENWTLPLIGFGPLGILALILHIFGRL